MERREEQMELASKPGSTAQHICADPDGNIYGDDVNHLIRKFDPKTGAVATVLGRGKPSSSSRTE